MMLSNAAAVRGAPDAVMRVLAVLRAMASRPSGLLGLIIVAAHVLIALFAGVLATHDFARQDATAIFSGPSVDHFLGADNLGRDVYSRTLLGGRIAIVNPKPAVQKVLDIVKAIPPGGLFKSVAELDAYLDDMQRKVREGESE